MVRLRVLMLAGALGAGACRGGGERSPPGAVLALERTGCPDYRCDPYRVQIAADGAVRFVRRPYAMPETLAARRVPADSARALIADFARARAAFLPRYLPGDAGCLRATHDDAPLTTVTLRAGTRTDTLAHFAGCRPWPAGFYAFAERIDRLADSRMWTLQMWEFGQSHPPAP